MKFLLKFIPFFALIDYVCQIAKDKVTSKTKTPLDDKAVDTAGEIAKEWAGYVLNPTSELLGACIRNSLNKLVYFADDEVLEELRKRINK